MESENTNMDLYKKNINGHKRRPSIGKDMPISSLFINLTQNHILNNDKHDGVISEINVNNYVNNNSNDDDKLLCSFCNNDNKCEKNDNITKPYKHLCNKLCNTNCQNNKISDKTSIKIAENRKTFLQEMCNNAECLKYVNVADSNIKNYSSNGKFICSIEINQPPNKPKDLSTRLTESEALANASMLTSPAAKRRLAARKIELEYLANKEKKKEIVKNNSCINNNNKYDKEENCFVQNIDEDDDEDDDDIPHELLLYLVRMGSFNSSPKILNSDTQDDNIMIPNGLSINELINHCHIKRGKHYPELLKRKFLKFNNFNSINGLNIGNDELTDGLRVLKLNAVSKVCSPPLSSPKHLRVFQWNILSQSLGQNNDGFTNCPADALTWECRRYQIVQEIIQNDPDVICLQEVDHFKFFQRILSTLNYDGVFFPKPDSPCLYINNNNGPDGCAIFYKTDKYNLVNCKTKILDVWRVQSNQVAILLMLAVRETGKEFCITTTHLKARRSTILSKIRNEQGKDLLRFVNANSRDCPIILCGDFNAEPIEPIYKTILNSMFNLSSAYSDLLKEYNYKNSNNNQTICNDNNNMHLDNNENNIDNDIDMKIIESIESEPEYTTWKIREDGEECHTIDYMFYSKDKLKANNCLLFPEEHEIGANRAPCYQYPSDHFSLLCDFEFNDDE